MSSLTELSISDRHAALSQGFLTLAQGVTDWDAPTPVKEWQARDVIEHLNWLPGMLTGWGVALSVPQHEDQVEQFKAQSEAVARLLASPEAKQEVDTQFMGVLPVEVIIERFYNFDLFAHSWDLARASGQEYALDAGYAEGAYQGMSAMGPALHATGQFGTPQPVADDAPVTDKLLALIGRDPHWAA